MISFASNFVFIPFYEERDLTAAAQPPLLFSLLELRIEN